MKNKKFWIALIVLLLTVVLLPGSVLGANFDPGDDEKANEMEAEIERLEEEQAKLEKEQAELEKQLADLQKEQAGNWSEIQLMVAEKTEKELKVGYLHKDIELQNQKIAAYALLIADKQLEVDAAEARLAELTQKHKERMRAMEEEGNVSYWSVLFQANSFSDFLDRLNIIEEIAAADKRRMTEMKQLTQELESARQVLITEKQELETNRAAFAEAEKQLEAEHAQLDALLKELMDRGEEYELYLEEQEKLLTELENQIAKTEYLSAEKRQEYKEYLEYLEEQSKKPTLPAGVKASYDKNGELWAVPCTYNRISSYFGWRTHPVYGDQRFHNGVDMATPCPNKIYAVRSGVVVISKYSSTAGYYVTIDHLDGYKSTYMHMCKMPDVKVGDVVTIGQVIGCIGTTGTSTGNHLHFGIYKNGEAVDPLEYVGNRYPQP